MDSVDASPAIEIAALEIQLGDWAAAIGADEHRAWPANPPKPVRIQRNGMYWVQSEWWFASMFSSEMTGFFKNGYRKGNSSRCALCQSHWDGNTFQRHKSAISTRGNVSTIGLGVVLFGRLALASCGGIIALALVPHHAYGFEPFNERIIRFNRCLNHVIGYQIFMSADALE
jgi:hypothetical protein